MTSTSYLGSTSIVLQFDLDPEHRRRRPRRPGGDQCRARSNLPANLPSNPSYRKVNPADAPILILALTSDTLGRGQMYDAASTILQQKLAAGGRRGAGDRGRQLAAGGARRAQPDGAREVRDRPRGRAECARRDQRQPARRASSTDGDRTWEIAADDQLRHAEQYRPLIVAYQGGSAVRLSDVATGRRLGEDLRNAALANGKPAVLVILFRQPGANIIETVDRVRSLLPQLRASLPSADPAVGRVDRTPTIRASLRDVERTLAVAIVLVILVVFVFLRNGRATLIPSVAVPVSLIGTFGVMYLCGLQSRQPLAHGAHDRDGLRRRRRDRRARERHPSPGAGHAGRARRRSRRAGDRLHGRLDEPLARRRLHPAPPDGRDGRPALPRVRGDAVGRRRRLAGRVAHDDAHDVRDASEAAR